MATQYPETSWWRSIVETYLPNLFVGGALLALLSTGGVLAWWIVKGAGSSPTFDFIGIVIIFMAALCLAAAIFVGLGLHDKAEAFGLPGGSMRVLFAIGVMILFVVFGLPMVAPEGADSLPRATTTVPAARLDAAIRLHRDERLRVRVIDYGSPTTPARFETFGRVDIRSAEEIDFGKQILAALITLLTSVISFYFGSRSASDATGMRAWGLGPAGFGPAPPMGILPGPAGTPSSEQLRKDLVNLAAQLGAVGGRLKALSAGPAAADNSPHAALIGDAELVLGGLETRREDVGKLLDEIDRKRLSLSTLADPGERSRGESEISTELQKAAAVIRSLSEAQAALAARVAAIA